MTLDLTTWQRYNFILHFYYAPASKCICACAQFYCRENNLDFSHRGNQSNFSITKLVEYNRMIIKLINLKNFGKFDYIWLAFDSVQLHSIDIRLCLMNIWWLFNCIWLLFLLLLNFLVVYTILNSQGKQAENIFT